MSEEIRFDNKVVVVTGGGIGLGRAYCLFFASKGAKVVVNDIGCNVNGVGTDATIAQKVVDEIKAKGGIAVADTNSVIEGQKIIDTAIKNFKKVDIIINNAGILKDVSFLKMKQADWDIIMQTHLKGTYSVTRAAFNLMRDQGYGRIINTASAAGLYGNFGQANYSTAKLGIHGFTQTIAKEGEKRNIKCNTVAPLAASRMTETVLPSEVLEYINPDYVVPLVAYLAHESCPTNGICYEIAGGYVSCVRLERSEGSFFDYNFGPEQVAEKWEEITSFERKNEYPTSLQHTMAKVNQNIQRQQGTSASNVKNITTTQTATSTSTAIKSSPTQIIQPTNLNSKIVFGMMQNFLARGEGKHLINKVKAVFGFDIQEQKGGPITQNWTIDLMNGQGSASAGKPKNPDAIFTMLDSDFVAVCQGKLNPQNAFMTGKMKIKGNMGKATKFTPDLFPPPTPENIAKYASAKL